MGGYVSPVTIPNMDSTDIPLSECKAQDPCKAAWAAAYAYAADKAYELAVYQALQGVAFGILQYASADRTADLQYDIADRQMKIAEEEYARYKEVYVACEDALARESCALTVPAVEYDLYASRAIRDVRRDFALAREKLQRMRTRFCFSDLQENLCDLERSEALAMIAARDNAYRQAEARQDILDDRRYNRRRDIVTQGRNIMTGQSDMYNSGMNDAIGAIGARGNAMRELLGTLSGAVGTALNYSYGPQINQPGMFMGGRDSGFQTRWGTFTNGSFTGGGSVWPWE